MWWYGMVMILGPVVIGLVSLCMERVFRDLDASEGAE